MAVAQMAFEDLYDRIWKYGGRRDFWLRHLDTVENFIRDQKLKPTDQAHFAFHVPMPVEEERVAVRAIRRPPLPGGIRVPHLHFKGDIYLLNNEQWQGFSAKIVKDMQAKLAKARTIGFEAAIDMAEAIDTVPLPE